MSHQFPTAGADRMTKLMPEKCPANAPGLRKGILGID